MCPLVDKDRDFCIEKEGWDTKKKHLSDSFSIFSDDISLIASLGITP